MWMRLVILEDENLRFIVEQALAPIFDDEPRQGARLATQLQPRLLEVIGIEVAVAAGPHEYPRLEPALSRQHVRQERVRGDIERHAEEEVGTALIKLEVE